MPQNKNQEVINKKEKNAILIGFIAILFILFLTLFKSFGFFKDTTSSEKTVASASNKSDTIYTTISFDDLKQKMRNDKNITLLDIRSFNEYIKEHAIDSINVPVDKISSSNKIDGNSVFVIIGTTDNDPTLATAFLELKKKNFEPLVLAGGIFNWKMKGGSTISFGDPTSFVDQSKVSYLEAEKAKEALEKESKILIVDVRDNTEFSKGHIKNAINIPILEIEKRKNDLLGSQNIFVFGSNEVQAFQAAVQMYDLTMNKAFVIKGSMPKWQELGYEIVK